MLIDSCIYAKEEFCELVNIYDQLYKFKGFVEH